MDSQEQRRTETASRVAYWMSRRGLTREMFAARMGRSLSWVDKIKRGDRALDRLSVLRHIAAVLDIPLDTLIGETSLPQNSSTPGMDQIAAVQDALHSYHLLYPSHPPTALTTLPQLHQRLVHAWTTFQASHLTFVGTWLADLLVGLHHHATAGPHTDLARRLAVLAYQLTAECAFKLGRADLGWLAADRGMHLAEATGDPALIGEAGRRIVHAMMAGSSSRSRATSVATAMADRLTSHITSSASIEMLSAYGSLLLKASIAHARAGEDHRALDLNTEAAGIAARLGHDGNAYWSAFGPTNVAIHRASALVDLGEGTRALHACSTIDPHALAGLTAGRRAQHTLNLARAHWQRGESTEASQALVAAARTGPGAVTCRPSVRALIGDLMHVSHPEPGLIRLARAIGIAA